MKIKLLPEISIKKLYTDVELPRYSTPGSAAADVVSREDYLLMPNERHIFKLGFSCAIPEGYAMLVCSRSGLSTKGIIVSNQPGIIDSDYRDEIGVILWNSTNSHYTVSRGDRIAQVMLVPVIPMGMKEVDELDVTSRKGGFGSTGV